jgi:hypothetical protein
LAIAGAAMLQEIDGPVPDHLEAWWNQDRPYFLHSAAWWRRHWERTGILDVEVADTLEDGWQYWRDWLQTIAPDNTVEIGALEADRGRYFGYTRAVGRRRADAPLHPPVVSVPTEYTSKPLLRGPGASDRTV